MEVKIGLGGIWTKNGEQSREKFRKTNLSGEVNNSTSSPTSTAVIDWGIILSIPEY